MMSAFDTAWDLCKNELCGDEQRIILSGKSVIGRCIRPKGHSRYGLNQNGKPLNRIQMALGGHVYELVEGIEFSNDDLFPKWGGGEPDPPKELRGME
jgi:hypothetical protein